MRRKHQTPSISKDVISTDQLYRLVSELRERVELLEREVYPHRSGELSPSQPRPPKGRRPKLHSGVLLERRVRLTAWLEQNWPRLSVVLRIAERSGSTSEAIATLAATDKEKFTSPYHSAFYEKPEQFEAELRAFLKSGRFCGNPRNLAGAMAGLPELSWKRSFDICAEHPYKTDYKIPAYWDHMRRKFPERLRELEEAETTLNVEIVLARSRTEDPVYLHLRDNPEKVKEWLEAGKPKI